MARKSTILLSDPPAAKPRAAACRAQYPPGSIVILRSHVTGRVARVRIPAPHVLANVATSKG